VVDDEPGVEALFRQQFRRDLREVGFVMEFAQSGHTALRHIADGNADLGKWGELQNTRLGIHEFGTQKRTYGAYEVYRNGSLNAAAGTHEGTAASGGKSRR
jgi:hypothetical protein